jgi:hypothetical protein
MDGNVLDSHKDEYTYLIGDFRGREFATPAYRKPPFKIGQTRNWQYKTNETPTDWAKRVKIEIISIEFMND